MSIPIKSASLPYINSCTENKPSFSSPSLQVAAAVIADCPAAMELSLSTGDASKKTKGSIVSDLGIALRISRSDDTNDNQKVHDRDEVVQLDLLPMSPRLRLDFQLSSTVREPKADKCEAAATGFRQKPHASSGKRERENDCEIERLSISRCSDEEETGSARKKLRLSKEQQAHLEESFKSNSTLNPKQKLALGKQLNLRPRQVEVWFQNRRARTKLKQTEVDHEHLKRCHQMLTEENRRLQRELDELRALQPLPPYNQFCVQAPAATLSLCPSCERDTVTKNSSKRSNGFPRMPFFSVPTAHFCN